MKSRSFSKLLAPFQVYAVARQYRLFLQCAFGVLLALIVGRISVDAGLDLWNLSLLYLFISVLIAERFGFWQATFFSVSGILYLNHFSGRPVVTPSALLRMGITFFLFEATAFVVSRMANRERSHAAQSEMQRHRTQRLHAVSHNVLLLNLQDTPERQIAEFIQQEFELDAVAIVTGSPASAGAAGLWAAEDGTFAEELSALTADRQKMRGISSRPLLSAKGAVGLLLILGDVPSVILDSLASLAALALERHRASMNEGLADAARRTEELRTTVLDGLAHAFKTPLTIIRAASSGLLEAGMLDEAQHQLIEMIDEQSERLDELTTRLLKTARVDGYDMTLQVETVALPTLIDEVVREFREEAADCGSADLPPINVLIERTPGFVSVDYKMIASTLKELLTNALKYSTAGSPITIRLAESSGALVLSVRSYGDVIRKEDSDLIFERFHRGPNHRYTAPGTGIGLSVARRVTEAHGGHIWVTSDEEDGTTFYLSLPLCSDLLESARG